MKPQSIRMPKELWSALEQDAEQRNRTTAEHIREICRQAIEQDVQDIYSRIDAIEDSVETLKQQERGHVGELEQRVDRLEQRTEQLDRLEQRVDRLESQLSGLTTRTVETAPSEDRSVEQQPAGEGPGQAVPTSVEDVDDVIAMARSELGASDSQLAAGRAALELLREQRRAPEAQLREAVRSDAPDPDGESDLWWTEQVKPIINIAMEWGLVVQHRGKELEWIGPPE